MKKFMTKGLVLGSIMMLTAITAVYAYFSDTLKVTNQISTGDVNIEMKEYQLLGKKEIPYQNAKSVMPGDWISKIPKITNLAMPCWIRVKIDWQEAEKYLKDWDDRCLSGMTGDWVKRGEYFYYTKVLKKSESVEVFRRVLIPDGWDETYALQKLSMSIRAEAIQAANFKPDFSAMTPWGNQKIELCLHEKDGNVTCRKTDNKLSVVFHGEAHRLIAAPDDFFANFGTVMPGDIMKDTLYISNTTGKMAEMFFRIESNKLTEEQKKLLREISMKIRMNGQLIYSGNVRAAGLGTDISLGNFEPGAQGNLEFTLEVPSSWNNSYALKKAETDWIFTVREEEESEITGTSAGDEKKSPAKTVKTEYTVKTGDDTPIIPVLVLLGAAGGASVGIILIRKRGKRFEE